MICVVQTSKVIGLLRYLWSGAVKLCLKPRWGGGGGSRPSRPLILGRDTEGGVCAVCGLCFVSASITLGRAFTTAAPHHHQSTNTHTHTSSVHTLTHTAHPTAPLPDSAARIHGDAGPLSDIKALKPPSVVVCGGARDRPVVLSAHCVVIGRRTTNNCMISSTSFE